MAVNIQKAHRRRKRRLVIKRPVGDTLLLYRLFCEERKGRRFYSISVTKADCGGTRRETKLLRDVTSKREDAYRIFDAVSRGLVTPMCADETVADLLEHYL